MCSITGSPTPRKAFDLYKNGLDRGHYSSGLLLICENESIVHKQQKPFEYEDLKNYSKNRDDVVYYALHSRAPTNTIQDEWVYDLNHPFTFGTFYVAHNGIINNLKRFPEHVEFDVDSSIIPYHLHVNEGDISKTYSKYEGLLTSWIFDVCEHRFNLIKAGSSLFIDDDSFSSVNFRGSECVESDGIIFELGDDRRLHEIDDFDYTSPYFLV